MSRLCAGIDIFDAIRDQSRKDVLNFFNCGGKNEVLDAYHQTPLHVAAASGNESIFSLLMSRGTNIHARDKTNETPLHKAAASGFLMAVKALVEEGAVVDAQGGRRHLTPLHRACQGGHFAVVEYLLKAGADPHRGDKEMSSPLHWAAYSGDVAVVKLLLEHGAEINARCQRRQTPLFCGCINGHIEVVRYLLAVGCDAVARSSAGALPEDRVDYLKVNHATTEVLKSLLRATRAGNRPNLEDVKFPNHDDDSLKFISPFQRKPSIPLITEDAASAVRELEFDDSERGYDLEGEDECITTTDTALLTVDSISTVPPDESTEGDLSQNDRVEDLERELHESQGKILKLEEELNSALVRLVKPVEPRVLPAIHHIADPLVGEELEKCKEELKRTAEEIKQHQIINDRLQQTLAKQHQEQKEKEEKKIVLKRLQNLSYMIPAGIFCAVLLLKTKK
mmetsp:Transcript_30220/g.39839  ORF Transcript_30220/g.39839 Transcript_30220/m.39839 type:complete len:452 (+) Transcript_30220:118-1473(+)